MLPELLVKKLLIATTNPAKLDEYRRLLRDFRVDPVSLRDAGIGGQAPEDAPTFLDNARLKARFYSLRCGLPVLADDGGLEVDALGGAPGVRSHRWLCEGIDDRALAEAVVARMSGVAGAARTARIRAAGVLVWREHGELNEAVAEAALEGLVGERCYAEVRRGFPYRSVLWLPERNQYLAELSDEDAAQLSQRRKIVEQLSSALRHLAELDG